MRGRCGETFGGSVTLVIFRSGFGGSRWTTFTFLGSIFGLVGFGGFGGLRTGSVTGSGSAVLISEAEWKVLVDALRLCVEAPLKS